MNIDLVRAERPLMKIKLYQVDAFADRLFSGNPAAVCPLDHWLSDELMLNIAAENNLAETAFYVKQQDRTEIRWFTPTVEVDLCGHATLAAAFVLFHHENHTGETIEFHSPRSGKLTVRKNDEFLTLNFPADQPKPVPLTAGLTACFDRLSQHVLKGASDYLFVFSSEEDILNLRPDFGKIEELDARGVIVTAEGSDVDFVSRFFGPKVGVNEDPVTGSAHTTLIPYWSEILGKTAMSARQLSERGGFLRCELLKDRVEIGGKAQLYLKGEIDLN